MAIDWYLHDLRGQAGPFDSTELRRKLEAYPNLDNVQVWRVGFDDWKPAAQVFDFRGGGLTKKAAKWRWASFAFFGGVLLSASDLLEWRGKKFVAWHGDGLAENIGYVIGTASILAFLGHERTLLQGAVLGFHRGKFAGTDFKDTAELEGQRKIFTATGFDSKFIARALATPSSEMWKPTAPELLNAGVITKVSQGNDYAVSGFDPDFSKGSLSNSFGKSNVYAAIKERFPSTFDGLVNSYYDGVTRGDTEASRQWRAPPEGRLVSWQHPASC